MTNLKKVIKNKVCAKSDCSRIATISIELPIGFSARFCEKCSAILLSKNLATQTQTPDDMVIPEAAPINGKTVSKKDDN